MVVDAGAVATVLFPKCLARSSSAPLLCIATQAPAQSLGMEQSAPSQGPGQALGPVPVDLAATGPSLAQQTKGYYTTQRINAMYPMQGHAELAMHYSMYLDSDALPNAPIWDVPEGMEAFLVTKQHIQGKHRCVLSQSLADPKCRGDGCIPCYMAHMTRLHGPRLPARDAEVLRTWEATLGSEVCEYPSPLQVGDVDVGTLPSIEPHLIRGLICNFASLLLAHSAKVRGVLASNGGTRLSVAQVLSMATTQAISGSYLQSPLYYTHRLARFPGGPRARSACSLPSA